jgi:hypothetical protein
MSTSGVCIKSHSWISFVMFYSEVWMEEYEQSLHKLWRVESMFNCRITFLLSLAYCKPV